MMRGDVETAPAVKERRGVDGMVEENEEPFRP
jgi:hypothetical protein